eukprot:TRINITY_DN23332_c0_g1_i1.p1 TRINITY_DN23332_c0_g1~~TRINITY_DN23332_c0_g1_i1.p1  ORF type:complete len:406 (+),score=74.77 TRINITY_DN23332_c0_g1_i1:36-1220(+)
MLFWESDSDVSDGGGWEEDSDLVVDESEFEDTKRCIKRIKIDTEGDEDPLNQEIGNQIFSEIMTLVPNNISEAMAGEHSVFGGALKDFLPEFASFSEIRSRIDLNLFTSTQHFESDLLKALFSACVADRTIISVLRRLEDLFRLVPHYSPTTLAVRFGSGKVASGAKNPHTTAYRRILDKFTLLDNDGLFIDDGSDDGSEEDEGEALPGPTSISEMRKNIDSGCYATDLDFETDLKWLYYRELIVAGECWETAKRLLALVTRCCEEGGIHSCSQVVGLYEQKMAPEERSMAEQLLLGVSSSLLSDCGEGFSHPVETLYSYRTIVRYPMDFSTIKMKFDLNMYTSIVSVVNDLDLMFTNHELYLKEASPEEGVSEPVKILKDEVKDLLKGLGLRS